MRSNQVCKAHAKQYFLRIPGNELPVSMSERANRKAAALTPGSSQQPQRQTPKMVKEEGREE
jgi:hypothetical protein